MTTPRTPVPLFQWLLHRPPVIRAKRTYLIISADPQRIHGPENIHENCKVQLCYGLYMLKKFQRANPMVTLAVPTRGRHRFPFKRVDYPEHTKWYAMSNPLPQGIQPTDLYNLWMDIIRQFEQANWRTERGTKEGVDEMERRFGDGLLVEAVTGVEKRVLGGT